MTSNQMRDLNRSAEMELLVRVVELGGFSAAARASGMTPSGVSKLITRLETRLGARLLNRSTRSLFLTQEGRAFYERCIRILADIDDAEREAAAASRPRGAIRVTVQGLAVHRRRACAASRWKAWGWRVLRSFMWGRTSKAAA